MYVNGEETANLKIGEYPRLTQKGNNSKHDLAGKVFHWEFCKRLKFKRADKWYIHKLVCVLEQVEQKMMM